MQRRFVEGHQAATEHPLAAEPVALLGAPPVMGVDEQQDVVALPIEIGQRQRPGIHPVRVGGKTVDDDQRRPRPVAMAPVLGMGEGIALHGLELRTGERVERLERAGETQLQAADVLAGQLALGDDDVLRRRQEYLRGVARARQRFVEAQRLELTLHTVAPGQ
ncbi:hypothetical protein D9M70_529260 [compost metagenome]